jgi:VanZ family protein
VQAIVSGYPIGEVWYSVPMTLILRLCAWLLAAAVTFATLGPPRFRPHSNFGHDGEHALAFVLLGLAFGLAYTRNRRLTAAISLVMIGVIEILQLWAPGRHARLEDFVVDALAACAGFAIAAGVDWVVQRSHRSSASAS